MVDKKESRPGGNPDRDDKISNNINCSKKVHSESTSETAFISIPADMKEFLDILDPDANYFHFQVLDDSGESNVFPATIVGTLQEKADLLRRKNEAGAGVFVAIQPHPIDKPRQAEFTTKIRTFFIDLDGTPLAPVLKTLKLADLNPSMIVNTSPGKYHIYLKASGCSLDQYTEVQKELASKFGGDKSVCDLPRVARVVGFWHKKDSKNPFKVKFYSRGNHGPYTFAQIVKGLNLELALASSPDKVKQTRNGKGSPFSNNEIPEGERNKTIFAVGRRLRALGVSTQEIKAEIVKANEERCNPALDVNEIDVIFKSILKYPPDPSPFSEITQEGDGSITSVMRISGIAELTTDSTADMKHKVIEIAVQLSKGMSGSAQILLKGEIQKKLKTVGVPSPAALVNKAFPTIKQDEHKDSEVKGSLQETEPYAEEVNGIELLEKIEAIISKYVLIENEAITAIALWVLHAWCLEAFSLSPFLRINSPTKGCGKTTLLMLISEVTPKCLLTANVTTASMFRLINKFGASIGIDEADGAFKENAELLSLVNASYTRSTAQVPRCAPETNEVELFSVWGPKVICGIGKLPPTTEDRSIIITLRKKKSAEKKERFRFDKLGTFGELKSKLKRFADDNLDALKDAKDPDLPKELGDRPADNWRQLIMIADLVGEDWPNKARAAAKALNGSQEDEEQLVHLLRDIRVVFNQQDNGTKGIPSANLTEQLLKIEGSPWDNLSGKYGDELTASKLARKLAPLGIKPKKYRFKQGTLQGYQFIDFDDAFARYLSNDDGKNDEEIDCNDPEKIFS